MRGEIFCPTLTDIFCPTYTFRSKSEASHNQTNQTPHINPSWYKKQKSFILNLILKHVPLLIHYQPIFNKKTHALCRIKMYLRNTIKEQLSAMAILNIEANHMEDIFDEFAKRHYTRAKLLLHDYE